jgi:hypothetical protein
MTLHYHLKLQSDTVGFAENGNEIVPTKNVLHFLAGCQIARLEPRNRKIKKKKGQNLSIFSEHDQIDRI